MQRDEVLRIQWRTECGRNMGLIWQRLVFKGQSDEKEPRCESVSVCSVIPVNTLSVGGVQRTMWKHQTEIKE